MDLKSTVRNLGRVGWGRALLMALAILTVTGGFFYLATPLAAIAAMLIFGIALPLFLGWTSLKQLAVAGLAVLLVGAALFAVLYAQQLRTPGPSGSTLPESPYGNGGSVLQAAHVDPYTGAAGGNYTFSVLLTPSFAPRNQTIVWLNLFISDCPGATGNDSPVCASGYPLFVLNHSFSTPPTANQTIEFHQALPGDDVWWWVMALVLRGPAQMVHNSTTNTTATVPGNLTYDWVYTQGSLGTEGPVSGSLETTVELVLPASYGIFLLYPGIVFYLGLLVYYVLKGREQRRKAMTLPTRPGAAPPDSPGGPPTVAAGAAPTTGSERSCPNCRAIVYPNEVRCWKCGADLAAPPSPLPSSPGGP